MNFGEKKMEYSAKHKKDIPVWQSAKYIESRAKAEEIVKSGKYGVQESDFWILMNTTKSDEMAYTGLIISHNGCLKINDCLASRFNPDCVSIDKDGYNGSLVYTYCNAEQGIYEVGEVSGVNCKNDYPYAMAYKRLFDRVVLKLSKLAYAGIYSDSEAEEFAQRFDDTPKQGEEVEAPYCCGGCGEVIVDAKKRNGEWWSADEIVKYSVKRFGTCLCPDCQRKAYEAEKAQQMAELAAEAACENAG